MAFINEKLTIKQVNDFVKRKIKLPESIPSRPVYHTIDKERNMCLTHLGVHSRDSWNDHWFLFDWNGDEYIICLNYVNPKPKCITWRISSYEKKFTGSEEFVYDLKNALTMYAVNGRPEPHGLDEINIEFGGSLK